MTLVSAERLSDIIGWIYDCAIDPSRWPATMEAICRELGFFSSVILLVDLRSGGQKYLAEWNTSPRYREMLAGAAFTPDVAQLFERGRSQRPSIDEPMVLSRIVPDREAYRQSPMYLEWAKPQGLGDGLNVTVLDEPPQIGTLAMTKREIDGDFSDGEVDLMRLLAPHIRRAVTIGGLLDMRTIEATTLATALDSFSVGVVLTDADAKIVFANGAARKMMQEQAPIRNRHGRLAALDAEGTSALLRAIDLAAFDEARIGGAGIGIPLNRGEEIPRAAHVLPLAGGNVRPQLMPSASAAVFVTPADSPASLGVQAASRAYGLTKAETRFLVRLAAGLTIVESAERLGISETTAKTHLVHIFSKCGVSRQADLMRLVFSLAAPVKGD